MVVGDSLSDTLIRSRDARFENCGRKSGTGTGFYPSLPPLPSQYYFTNDPYTLFMCVLSMLCNVTRHDFNRMTHTLSSCAFYRCCIMLLGMISTAFVKKDTCLSHDATCYLQGHFLRHVRIIAKSAYTSSSHLSVSLSVRPSVRPSVMCHRCSH